MLIIFRLIMILFLIGIGTRSSVIIALVRRSTSITRRRLRRPLTVEARVRRRVLRQPGLVGRTVL
jgi:hypothetical protein